MSDLKVETSGLDEMEIAELLDGYSKAPKVIYLQRGNDDTRREGWPSERWTWCDDKINRLDVAYIRIDLCEKAPGWGFEEDLK